MKHVIVAKGADGFIIDTIQQLKFSMNDRSTDVRATFYEVLHYWMTNMEFQALRDTEMYLIGFLLNGTSDEDKEIS